MASDGQVTFDDTVVKQTAKKIRKLYKILPPGTPVEIL